MAEEIVLPGGQKVPAWVAIATAAGAFLLVIVGSGGGKKTQQTTAADKVLLSEYQQRLKEQRDEAEQWRDDQEDIYQQWREAQSSQWKEFKIYLDSLLKPLQKPVFTPPFQPIGPPQDGAEKPEPEPIRPMPPIPSRPGDPMPKGGGYTGVPLRIGAQFFDNLLYGYSAQVPKIDPMKQTTVKRGYL